MSIELVEVAWDDPRAVSMRASMDAEMQLRYAGSGLDPVVAAAAFTVDPADVVSTVVAVAPDGTPVGHAALRRLGNDWEIKRVVVDATRRGAGIAGQLMAAVEAVAAQRGADRVILQTGDRQPEAVALYTRLGYLPIPIYPPYSGLVPFSLCFEKSLDPGRPADDVEQVSARS